MLLVHSLIHVHDYLPFIVLACSSHTAISQLIWMAPMVPRSHPGGAITTRPCSAKQKKLHFPESGPLNLGTDCWTSVPSTITSPCLLECVLCLLVGPLEVILWDAAMSGLQFLRPSQEGVLHACCHTNRKKMKSLKFWIKNDNASARG